MRPFGRSHSRCTDFSHKATETLSSLFSPFLCTQRGISHFNSTTLGMTVDVSPLRIYKPLYDAIVAVGDDQFLCKAINSSLPLQGGHELLGMAHK